MDQNPAQTTTPVNPESAPLKQRPSGLIGLMLVLIILLLASSAYLFYQNTQLKKQIAAGQNANLTTPSSNPASETETNELSISGTLQNFMKANCQTGNPAYLELSKLLVNLNSDVIKPYNGSGGKEIYCVSTRPPAEPIEGGYLVVNLKGSSIYIYDDKSQELGHGGAPFLGLVGEEIYNQEGVQISTWLQREGDGGPNSPASIKLMLRGIKKFTTQTGSAIYVNYTATAIPTGDSRIVKQLEPYTKDVGYGPEVNYDQTVAAKIAKSFFTETPPISTPEGKSLQNIKDVMAAITAK